jgi:hypothetical protein
LIEECRDLEIQEWNFRDSSNTAEHPPRMAEDILQAERLYQMDNKRRCRNKVFSCKCHY